MMKGQKTEKEFLQEYNADIYEKPSVTVDMLIFSVAEEENDNYRKLPEKVLKLLLIKRGEHPYMGQWALPGGFVGVRESVDDAAVRELRAETNIENIYMEQLYTWGDVHRDPRTRVISCSYMALVDSTAQKVQAGDDAAEAGWFKLDYSLVKEKKTILENGYIHEKWVLLKLTHMDIRLEATVRIIETMTGKVFSVRREIIDSVGLAFDHAQMIQYAVERLRNKIEHTDIAFNLMPELFTLSELQQVYEIILGRELLPAAFRRKIANMVIETDHYTRDAGHRPSRLFRFNPLWRESED